MMFIKENKKSELRFSKVRPSNAFIVQSLREADGASSRMLMKKKMSPTKPSCVTKRSVSLPADLQNTKVKSRKLFWFIPRDRRDRRRRHACEKTYREVGNSHKTSALEEESPIKAENLVTERCLLLHQDIPEKVALEWITSSSSHSLSDSTTSHQSEEWGHDDEQDGPLFGLEFVDVTTEASADV